MAIAVLKIISSIIIAGVCGLCIHKEFKDSVGGLGWLITWATMVTISAGFLIFSIWS